METPACEVDLLGRLGVLKEDGSFTRTAFSPEPVVPADPGFEVDGVVRSKDIVLFSEREVWVRIYLPKEELETQADQSGPVLFYFHGGGFVLGSAAGVLVDTLCRRFAREGHLLVVNVEYRLAPEHRLPAAFDDCFDAAKWAADLTAGSRLGGGQQRVDDDPWLRGLAGSCPGRFILAGHSAGGSIVHHVALRCAAEGLGVGGGLLMGVPFFGGQERAASETELGGPGASLTLVHTDALWFLALPDYTRGRNHPFCNVLLNPDLVRFLRPATCPPVRIVAGQLDLLFDRQREYAQALRALGLDVEMEIIQGGEHTMMMSADKADQEFYVCLRFLNDCKAKLDQNQIQQF